MLERGKLDRGVLEMTDTESLVRWIGSGCMRWWKNYEKLADDIFYTPEYGNRYERAKKPLNEFLPIPRKNAPCPAFAVLF
jgi:hypothetical protein